ncbi:MAG TPA: hypothetical protein VF230_11750 [Acidimicrobiales bacterium]
MSEHETPGDEMTRVDDATREEERREATVPASAGRGPTAEEEAAAEQNDVDPAVAQANKEAVERGASLEGEGRIEP